MSLNGYSWVEGNVTNATDPAGLCPDNVFTGYIDDGCVGFHTSSVGSGGASSSALRTYLAITYGLITIDRVTYLAGYLDIPITYYNAQTNTYDFDFDALRRITGDDALPIPGLPRQDTGAIPRTPPNNPGIDPNELWRVCNQNVWCAFGGLGIMELLRRLFRWSDRARVRPRDGDDDCLDGETTLEAAHRFAREAQGYWLDGTQAAGANAPLTTAVTVVKLGSECVKHVAISNPLNNPTDVRVERYQNAFDGITRSIGNSGVPVGYRIPNTITGFEGHAERLLHNDLGNSIKAMGVSQIPCGRGVVPDSCSVWFRTKPIKIAYWDSGNTRTFQ